MKNGSPRWGLGAVYYGSFKEWLCQQRKPRRKFLNFMKIVDEDILNGKQCTYVFIGDTGEGDKDAGKAMCRTYPASMKALFLHVISESKDGREVQLPEDYTVEGVPVIHFRTYAGAANKALAIGLIDKAAATRVFKAARAELNSVPRGSSKWDDLLADIGPEETGLGSLWRLREALPAIPAITLPWGISAQMSEWGMGKSKGREEVQQQVTADKASTMAAPSHHHYWWLSHPPHLLTPSASDITARAGSRKIALATAGLLRLARVEVTLAQEAVDYT
ncbi:unnamed protein product [Chrysoparadoxa australica]